MKILFVLEYYHPHVGGVETLFKSLIEKLADNGHSITVLTNRFRLDLPSKEKSGNITVIRYNFYNRYLFTLLACLPAIRLAFQHDIIHTTSYNAAVPARIASLFSRKKLLITFHEVWGSLWFRLPWMSKGAKCIHYLFEQSILKFNFHKVIAVSNATAQALEYAGVSSDKIVVIYNGIDYATKMPVWQVTKGQLFTFTFFGRLSYSKGVDMLLNAAGLLKQKIDTFSIDLIVAQESEYLSKQVKKLIEINDLKNHVNILAPLPFCQLQEKIARTNAVVFPSYSEGFCFAAVETMAIGTPIISSGQAALSEVISGTHIRMKSFDANGLVQAMQAALDNKWNYTEPVQFHLSDTINKYEELYSQP